ncbi:MAG: DDE-type integrase/transposase/recombinase [Patescibacteria group bacterium]|nr:DDE-type integrase/transposase/recombinase [Patescibacteria group bacterium]
MANRKQTPAYPAKVRSKWYYLVDKCGKSVNEVCNLYFISRKTYYKWKNLDNRSKKYIPRKTHPQTKIKGELAIFIYEQKNLINYGPRKMKLLIKRKFNIDISTTAIYNYYKKKNLIFRPQKRLPWYQPIKNVVVPKEPGEVVQVDAKYVWIDNARKYQRTFIDIFTGFHHAVITNTLTSKDTIQAFNEAEVKFPFKIFGIQSDNGSENRGEFHQYLGKRGIAHYFIPKSSPTWDGTVERAHGVIDQEYYLNYRKPWKTLFEYLTWYNYERIHLGKYLNGLTPIEKFNNYQLSVTS